MTTRRLLTILAATMCPATLLWVDARALQASGPLTGQARAPRILVLYDLEGASGVLNGHMMNPGRPDTYSVGRESLIRDVATVVEALYEGGASSVDLQNTHGDLDPTLVPADRLSPRVRVRPSQPVAIYHPDAAREFKENYDAIVTIGMHTKPLGGGFSPHTIGNGLSPYINGRTRTETELIGYSVGTVGLPVILVTGDGHLQRDLAQSMPWAEYIVVKNSVDLDSAEGIPASEVQARLREGTLAALRQIGRMRVMTLGAPIRAGLLATFPNDLPQGLKNGSLPGVHATGDTVWIEAADYRGAFLGIRVLMTIAQARNAQRSMAFLREQPGTEAAFRTLRDSTRSEWRRIETRAAAGK